MCEKGKERQGCLQCVQKVPSGSENTGTTQGKGVQGRKKGTRRQPPPMEGRVRLTQQNHNPSQRVNREPLQRGEGEGQTIQARDRYGAGEGWGQGAGRC